MTLKQLRENTDAAEYPLWREWFMQHGFPADRLEAGVALAGMRVCQAHGVKDIEMKHMLPKFGPVELVPKNQTAAVLRAWAKSIGAEITHG